MALVSTQLAERPGLRAPLQLDAFASVDPRPFWSRSLDGFRNGAPPSARHSTVSSTDDTDAVDAPPMRIGIVCPYSLTIPGGVQMQVLALARELRARGHEARVLGPCDGPPPESFVTPLGNSLPLAANGSIAPLAPDPPAAFRTMRALTDEAFDVIHVHEPLAPGPALTSVLFHPAPIVATFHAAGSSTSYRLFNRALSRIIKRIDHKVVVSKDALALVQSHKTWQRPCQPRVLQTPRARAAIWRPKNAAAPAPPPPVGTGPESHGVSFSSSFGNGKVWEE